MKDALTVVATVDRIEEEAIARARGGDAGAFEYLYKAHCRHVYSVCLRMIKNPVEAEDLTQQTFLQVFRKIGTFRGQSEFSTWLHRVTVNIVLMHLRRKKRAEVLFEDLNHTGSDNKAPREHGSGDSSMLGAIDRLDGLFKSAASQSSQTIAATAAWRIKPGRSGRGRGVGNLHFDLGLRISQKAENAWARAQKCF